MSDLISDKVHAASAVDAVEVVVEWDVDGEALGVCFAANALLTALGRLLGDQVL